MPFLLAADFSTRYDVDVGMFGKVGYADVSIQKGADSYKAKVVATMTGTAATLTGNRVETYVSEGEIQEGRYLPHTFTRIKKNDQGERIQTYTFDHQKRSVRLNEEKSELIKKSSFDPIAFKIVKTEVLEHSNKEVELETYNEQDLLSAYLNTVLNCNAGNKKHTLLAVGAHNDEKDITLSFLEGMEKERLYKEFGKNEEKVYQLKVQALDKSEDDVNVLLSLDNDGHIKEAVLADNLFIGEVKATRVYHQVSRSSY